MNNKETSRISFIKPDILYWNIEEKNINVPTLKSILGVYCMMQNTHTWDSDSDINWQKLEN